MTVYVKNQQCIFDIFNICLSLKWPKLTKAVKKDFKNGQKSQKLYQNILGFLTVDRLLVFQHLPKMYWNVPVRMYRFPQYIFTKMDQSSKLLPERMALLKSDSHKNHEAAAAPLFFYERLCCLVPLSMNETGLRPVS